MQNEGIGPRGEEGRRREEVSVVCNKKGKLTGKGLSFRLIDRGPRYCHFGAGGGQERIDSASPKRARIKAWFIEIWQRCFLVTRAR